MGDATTTGGATGAGARRRRRGAGLVALVLIAAGLATIGAPAPAGAAGWTPPAGLPTGFPTPPSNLDASNFWFSPRTAKKGDTVTINSTGGYINLLKVWSGYPTQGTLTPKGTCTQAATSCQFTVGASSTGWQGWLVLGALLPSGEVGPYDALAILPSGPVSTPPGKPTGVTHAIANGAATVSWTNGPSGGEPVTATKISMYVDGVAQGFKLFLGAVPVQTYQPVPSTGVVRFTVQQANSVGDGQISDLSVAVPPPFTSLAAFVDRQARDLMGRAPTAAESAAAIAELVAGASPGEVVEDFRRSTDATTNVDPTTRLYFAYLQRVPDKGGLQYWVNKKRAGTTVSRISDVFANSNEFKTKYGTLTNRQFVTRIYTDVLGRTADTAGVDYWTGKLDRREKNRGQVMVGFSESSEYKRKKATSVDVAVTWIGLLQAAPSKVEFDAAVAELGSGGTLVALADDLLGDPRYAARF